MKDYWSLPRWQRANLTTEQLQAYIPAELMKRGVEPVRPLELMPVPEVPPPDKALWVIKYGYFTSGYAFATQKAAQAAVDSGLTGTTYLPGCTEHVLVDDRDFAVAQEKFYSPELAETISAVIAEASTIKTSNARAQEEHTKAKGAEREALRGLYEDWEDSVSKKRRASAVIATLTEYRELSEDDRVALKFLSNTYKNELISIFEWADLPTPPLDLMDEDPLRCTEWAVNVEAELAKRK